MKHKEELKEMIRDYRERGAARDQNERRRCMMALCRIKRWKKSRTSSISR